jgi:hypothetical protein
MRDAAFGELVFAELVATGSSIVLGGGVGRGVEFVAGEAAEPFKIRLCLFPELRKLEEFGSLPMLFRE